MTDRKDAWDEVTERSSMLPTLIPSDAPPTERDLEPPTEVPPAPSTLPAPPDIPNDKARGKSLQELRDWYPYGEN